MKKEALEKIDKIFKIVGESLEGKEKLKNFGFDSYLDLVENAEKSEVSRKKLKAFSDRLDSYFSELNKAFQSSDKNYLEFKKSLEELNEKLEADSKVRTAADLIEFRANIDKKLKENDKKKEGTKKENDAEKKENIEEERSENQEKRVLTKIETEWIKDVKFVKTIALSIITIISILPGIMIVATSAPGFWSFVGIVALLDTTVVAMSKILTCNHALKFIRNAGNAKEGVKKFLKSSLKKGKEKFLGLFKKKEKSKNKKAKKVVSKAKTKVVASNPKSDSKKDDTIDVIRELAFGNQENTRSTEQDISDVIKEATTMTSEEEKRDTAAVFKEVMTQQQGEKDSELEKEESSEVEVAPEKTEVKEDKKAEESVVEQENKSMLPEENKSDEISQAEKPVEKEEPQLEKVSGEEDSVEQKYRKYFSYVLSLKNEISRMEKELATKSGDEYKSLAEQITAKKGIYESICKDMSLALTEQYSGISGKDQTVKRFDSTKIDQIMGKEKYGFSESTGETGNIEKAENKKYNQYSENAFLEYALKLRNDIEIMNEELATKYGNVDPEQRANDQEYLKLKYKRNATRNAYLEVCRQLKQMLATNQEVVNREGKSK